MQDIPDRLTISTPESVDVVLDLAGPGTRISSGAIDLALQAVIEIGYDHGVVESTCLRVDDTWAGLKFTRPRPGQVYRNSYGSLPARTA